jgi:excisionase family DNA binding protein
MATSEGALAMQEALADKRLLSPAEAAHTLGISRSTLYALLASGLIRSVSVGRLRRIRSADLDDYVSGLQPAPLN